MFTLKEGRGGGIDFLNETSDCGLWPCVYTNKYRQIKFRMKVYNNIGKYKNKSTTTINKI
jgi:hypothetical protein